MRTTSAAVVERVSIPVSGSQVAGTLFLPPTPPTGVVIIHPATATPERFYTAFAETIVERGLAAVTYDYRGTARSGDPRTFARIRMRDWMTEDVPAVAEWVTRRLPGLPQYAVGHSIGGHAMTLGYGVAAVERIVLISSHLAATRQISQPGERLRVALILNIVGPLLSRMLGYMPGKRLGLGEDIPSAAMIEWGNWARRPGYFFDDESMRARALAATVDKEILAIGASDDAWASPRQMDALTGHLSAARVQRRTVTPDEIGAARIGHHGLLRKRIGEPLWPELLDWLTRDADR